MTTSNDFHVEASRRMPLAESVLRLLHYSLEDDFLAGVFERHRGRCFERDLSFPTFVHVISDALLHRDSLHQAVLHAQTELALDVSFQAVYARLATIPCEVSTRLLAEATTRLDEVSICVSTPVPPSLIGYRCLALDGKKMKYVLKRLKVLRGLKGNVLGSKLLVAQDMTTRQAVVVEAHLDGEAADHPLVASVVAQARALPDSRPRLWVADRGFCDFRILALLSEADDDFLVREHSKCKFHRDPSVPIRTGKDELGRSFTEEWGWLGAADNPRRVQCRRIVVERPGYRPLVLLTSLLDADRYPAEELLLLYRRRWGIETMFQRLVQTFDLRHLIGGTPEATVFQACFCMLLYNIVLIVRDYVAEGAQLTPETVSLHLLHSDLVDELIGWMIMIGPDATPGVLGAKTFATPEDLQRYLRERLGGVWKERLRKSKTTKRGPKKTPRAYLKGGHSSVDRIRRGVHEEILIKPRKTKAGPTPAATPATDETKS